MERMKRKPLSDITHLHNLTPLSVLRELVASNEFSKSKPNRGSTSSKLCPEPSERSSTSIGSSSVGAGFNSKTDQFRHPQLAVCSITSRGDIGITDAARNRRQNIAKSKKERDANVVSCASVEEKKDKRKAIVIQPSSSASEKMKVTQNKICNLARAVDGVRIQKIVDFSIPMDKHSDLQSETIKKCRKEREPDVIDCHTSIMKRKDKGKAIAMSYTSSPTGKLKDTQNKIGNSSILADGPCQKDVGDLGFSSGSVEKVKDADKDMFIYSYTSGKAEKGKAKHNFSDRTSGEISETGNDIADTSCCLVEKRNDKNKGILKRNRSSTVQLNDKGEEYLKPSTSSFGGAKGRAKSVNTPKYFPDKMKGKEGVIHEPSNIVVSTTSTAVKSRLSRKSNEKNKNAVGVSSCPPMTRSKNIKNDLYEFGDVKYSDSWTDPQAKGKKKRRLTTGKTNELPEDFIREQKAYFDDIDNFELPVEEVSQDELD